jgi:peptidoglycan/xylan/chitin deacetylase (PgdA/CDA1 family)
MRGLAVCALAAVVLFATSGLQAEETCKSADALGVSRAIEVDTTGGPWFGEPFGNPDFLKPGEVVLTFDDGPWPATDQKILAALAHECVRATFFLIGKPASEHPELVRRIAAQGHTIAHHTWTHHNLKYMKPEAAIGEIDKGIAAVETALHGKATTTPSTPFFRFPSFEMTPATLDALQKRGIAVFGADLWASDWDPMTPAQQLKLLTERLQVARKGIILLHDPKAQTTAMLPAFLRWLRDNRYRVVHLVSAGAKTVSDKAH